MSFAHLSRAFHEPFARQVVFLLFLAYTTLLSSRYYLLSGLSRIFRKPFANVYISRKVPFALVRQIYACGPRSYKTFHGFSARRAMTYILSCDTIFSIVNTIPAPRFIRILSTVSSAICVSSAPLIPFRDPSVPSASYPGATAQHASWNTFPLRHRSKRSLRQLGGWQKGFQLFLLLLGRQDFFLLVKRKNNKREVGLQNWSSISQRS